MKRRVLYIQYTNPAGYPPLEHSSQILADAGWQILFLGVRSLGTGALVLPPHPRVLVRCFPFLPEGGMRKLHYLGYAAWALLWALIWRPGWIYASDTLSCPVAELLSRSTSARLLYHEHDEPDSRHTRSWFFEKALHTRIRVARQAELCLFPNGKRLARFSTETGRSGGSFLVWNCSSRAEVAPERAPRRGEGLSVIYQGSVVPARLPMTVLEALARLPEGVRLRVIGYPTVGYPDYIERLKETAARQGLSARVEFLEAMPWREVLLRSVFSCDVGIALMPVRGGSPSERAMEGASNKPFDYLAGGLAVLVSDLLGWKRMYVDPGYALACNPEDPKSIAEALKWFLEHPRELREMGEKGRRRILEEWNYEKQFQPVLEQLEASVR